MIVTTLIALTCLVYGALSKVSFLENVERAKIFELTDNAVPTIRINIPIEDFKLLKEKAIHFNYPFEDQDDTKFQKYKFEIYNTLDLLQKTNYSEAFPSYNFTEALPALKIDNTGSSNIDIDEILNEFNFNEDDYSRVKGNTFLPVLKSNDHFNLIEVLSTLSQMDIYEESKINDSLYFLLKNIKLVDGDNKKAETINEYMFNFIPEFKTKNSHMTFELNSEKQTFKKITFSLSGQLSRSYSKPNYNIKIRGNKELFGRSQFKLRSDCIEPSFIRTKLISDIHNRLGLPSLSANYVNLYINDEFMGFYILTDSFKPSWVKYVYGEENTTTLYKCTSSPSGLSVNSSTEGCVNENEDVTDKSEWTNFLSAVDAAQSIPDLEDILDVDEFLTEMVLEYLLDGWDHIQSGHNFFMFKPKDGKWTYLSHDFDLDLGQDYNNPEDSYISPETGFHFLDVLMSVDRSRFEEILKKVVLEVFNPMVLYPHIDEIKEFIRPYVVVDKTPDANGIYPGKLNTASDDFFSLEEWDANTEFTTVKTHGSKAFGLKYWILGMYRFVCKEYELECDPTYIDENYEYPIDKDVEFVDDEEIYINENFYSTDIGYPIETETALPEVFTLSSEEEYEIPTDVVVEEENDSSNEEETAL